MVVPQKLRLTVVLIAAIGAAAAAVAGEQRLAVGSAIAALLLLASSRLARADRQSPDYVLRVVIGSVVVGLGFLTYAVLALADVVHPKLGIATPMSFLAGLMFLDLARRINRDRR